MAISSAISLPFVSVCFEGDSFFSGTDLLAKANPPNAAGGGPVLFLGDSVCFTPKAKLDPSAALGLLSTVVVEVALAPKLNNELAGFSAEDSVDLEEPKAKPVEAGFSAGVPPVFAAAPKEKAPLDAGLSGNTFVFYNQPDFHFSIIYFFSSMFRHWISVRKKKYCYCFRLTPPPLYP